MATKRKSKARATQLAFEALSIEGGLLSPEWLYKVAQLQADTQAEADYRIHKGLNLRDEIGRYWRIAQAHWVDFKLGRDAKGDPKALAERFVSTLLRDAFGFASLAAVAPAVLAERSYPIGQAALGGRVPVVIAPADGGLDILAFGDGARKRSAFGLAQEYLNAQEGALWGVASDGSSLRIVRDNASLTRPAWIEADLHRIFTEERYADFAGLWLLCHETRFGREDQPVTECALEVWRNAGREGGTRAREHLRRGVEDALAALGQGFLSHADNVTLRAELQNGTLPVKDYFNQLLRLVYRLIFLLTVEERGLLHPDGMSDAAKALYANGYGIRRLRERSVKRSAHDRFADLWDATKVVCRGLAAGEPRLGLPALAGIFASSQCPALDGAKLENRALLLAMFKLAWLREDGSLARVNWRDMGPEELGSVYESLLELVPQIAKEGRQFAFAAGGETKGNARKTTGSYYTPDSLVQVLLDNALEPVVADAIAKQPGNPVEALLGLTIVDPACGSGHFLLAAARRLAAHVARLQANGTPSAAEYRHALRQVVGRCIFGVDLNPMAVELCKVGLWMEAVEPGLPLTFLNSHIQCGNALLGTTPVLMAKGIPDAAWDPIEGDDKKTASALKKRNKAEAGGQRTLDFGGGRASEVESEAVTRAVTELDAASDANVEALAKKEERWDGILGSPEYCHQKFVADAWCAAFVWPKRPGELTDAAPTNELWRQLRDAQGKASAVTTRTVEELVGQYCFFHWHLQFPQVFAKGGFDVVLGNPPWDTLSPDAKEFFSQYDENVRFKSPDEQKICIAALREDQAINFAWETHCRWLYGSVAFIKESGRYDLFAPGNLGKGDFNVFRMFVELALTSVGAGGRASQIVPEGIYNGANCMKIREHLFERSALQLIYGFENHRHVWFDSVDTRAKFALYVATVPGRTMSFQAAFNIRSQAELRDAMSAHQPRALELPVSLVREFSPDALALMELSNQRDIDIAAKMYAAHPKFGDESGGPPQRMYMRELDMGNDRDLFTEDANGIPLYEGRMVAAYDHRAKGYRSGRGRKADWSDLSFADPAKSIQPQWFVRPEAVPDKVRARYQQYRVGFCDVASPTNERTLVATLIPAGVLCGHKVPTVTFEAADAWYCAAWLAVTNSFVMDFLARKKVSLSMTYTILDSLPFPRLQDDDPRARFLASRVARLVCTAPEMNAFWDSLASIGWFDQREGDRIPGEIDEAKRAVIEGEIDAYVARELFALGREELSYVLDSFPIIEKRDRKSHGEYRTKRIILDVFDAMEAAAGSGRPYETRLSPPPADPRVAHPPREGGQVLPFRPAARQQLAVQPAVVGPDAPRDIPAWNPELLPVVATKTGLAASAGQWGTTLTGVDLGIAALAAVLRNIGDPASRDEVERAVVLSVLPGLLQSKFDAQTAPKWRRAIGAANMNLSSIAALAIPWAEVLRRATVEHLLVMDADGRWRAGADIDDAPSDVLDARALVALSWLESASSADVEDAALVTHLGALRAA